ncbi:MAG: ferritin family protein [Deltaproteobacteria bacterium]|nr:ferritin family protein [Deltaproteobacteria bacterium]MBW2673748.1 ferritin family protein [Deltaproteobacteria bacterium]
MKFESLESALTFAADKESAANMLYTSFRNIVKSEAAKKLLEELAAQELNHKALIEHALASGDVGTIGGKQNISEISFSNYMVAETIDPDSDPQDIMQFAMKMEQAAYDLYNGLLENYGGTNLGPLFSRLAREELQHKEILEDQYEKHFAQWM